MDRQPAPVAAALRPDGDRTAAHGGNAARDHRAEIFDRDMRALAQRVPIFAAALDRPDRIPALFRPPGFGALIRLILEQQVSVSAAATMWRRLTEQVWPLTPEGLLALDDATLKACGFSARKTGYARGLAGAFLAGDLVPEALEALDDEAVIARLTAIRGIGRWTAECYLLWAMARRDVLPAGDLAIQVGYQELAGLETRPDAGTLRAAAEAWHPHRSAASLLLWRVYLDNRATDGSTRKFADPPAPARSSAPTPSSADGSGLPPEYTPGFSQ